MDDLISRAAAIAEVEQWAEHGHDVIHWTGIKAMLEIQPAVDAVPVIRCANYKWWNGSTLGVAHRCAALHIATTGEFYCAAAERKSNACADQSCAEYADNPTV